MERTAEVPLEKLYDEQKAYLDAFWKNAVLEIDGDADLTCAVNYNLYQLLQSAGRDRYSGIASKG
jgi:alpha,alpha-trehalose phosphorylase